VEQEKERQYFIINVQSVGDFSMDKIRFPKPENAYVYTREEIDVWREKVKNKTEKKKKKAMNRQSLTNLPNYDLYNFCKELLEMLEHE
jgi:hypothetical protein